MYSLLCSALEEHIVNIYLHVSLDLSTKHSVDQPLVSDSYILQPEWHYFVTVKPLTGD